MHFSIYNITFLLYTNLVFNKLRGLNVMKKLILFILLVLSLSACCSEEEIENCVKSKNGLSYESCYYALCR